MKNDVTRSYIHFYCDFTSFILTEVRGKFNYFGRVSLLFSCEFSEQSL